MQRTVRKGQRILLAEDNELNAEIAITVLEEAEILMEQNREQLRKEAELPNPNQ